MVAVLALASLHVPNAGASTVAIQRANNVRLVYTAAADEANRGAVARAVDGAYLIEDLGAVIVPSSTGECTRVDDHHARCAAPDVQGVAVALGDLDDAFTVSDNAYPDTSPIGVLPMSVDGVRARTRSRAPRVRTISGAAPTTTHSSAVRAGRTASQAASGSTSSTGVPGMTSRCRAGTTTTP